MSGASVHAVTGAFGYSGKYMAQRLLDAGHEVITLTNSLQRPNPFGDRVKAYPYHFDAPEKLTAQLEGVQVLYITYWVRFNHRDFTQADAVQNTLRLFEAAQAAGVERIVHVSITKPSLESELEYFRSKAQLEEALKALGVSYGILRPAVLFGGADILVNNIAWALRRFPLFGVFGDGEYRLQPIHVDDFARLAIELGASREDQIVNAIGPETFTYRELVSQIGEIIGKRRRIVSVSPEVGYWAAWIAGKFTGDVMLTRDEIAGLMQDLLHVETPPTGNTRLTDWAREHAETLGTRYHSELARRKQRDKAYESL